jgi:hypothetical protein
MRYLLFALPCVIASALGCSGSGTDGAANSPLDRGEAKKDADADKEAAKQDVAKPGANKNADAKEATPRKVIYTATLDVIVEDFDKATEGLASFIREQDAFVESWDMHGERGRPRSGRWTVRVPQAHFEDLLTAVAKLGETVHNRRDSQDVSGSYYDTRERLKTFEVEEDGLRKYYESKSPTAKPEDMMAVRRELKEIRAQIEEIKGRLKRWDNQVEYATVVINLQDRKDYVPPVMPNFGGSIGRAFQGSIEALVAVGKGIVLTAVALAPWLAIAALLGSPWWPRLWRRFKARKRVPTEVVPPAAPSA